MLLIIYFFDNSFMLFYFWCSWHLKVNYNIATIHYERASQKMHEGYLNTPGLFLFSKTDPVSNPEMNASVYEKWEKKGLEVRFDEETKTPS